MEFVIDLMLLAGVLLVLLAPVCIIDELQRHYAQQEREEYILQKYGKR